MRSLLPGAEHSRFSIDLYIMKRLSLILLLLFAAWGGLRAQPALTLLQKGYDLGSIPEDGGTVSRVYTFRNSGNAPLVVVRAETSCTCTKADISKKPVMPGQEGPVTVTYNPRRQHGAFNKAISIYTNVPGARYVVTLRGEVTVR